MGTVAAEATALGSVPAGVVGMMAGVVVAREARAAVRPVTVAVTMAGVAASVAADRRVWCAAAETAQVGVVPVAAAAVALLGVTPVEHRAEAEEVGEALGRVAEVERALGWGQVGAKAKRGLKVAELAVRVVLMVTETAAGAARSEVAERLEW